MKCRNLSKILVKRHKGICLPLMAVSSTICIAHRVVIEPMAYVHNLADQQASLIPAESDVGHSRSRRSRRTSRRRYHYIGIQ